MNKSSKSDAASQNAAANLTQWLFLKRYFAVS